MNRLIKGGARVGAGVVVLAAAMFGAVPTAAFADSPLPDLQVSFDRDASAGVNNAGDYYGVYVQNYGAVTATAVTLTIDLSNLSDDVVASVPDFDTQCKQQATTITCAVGTVDPGQTVDVSAWTMASKPGAKIGAAGDITATAAGAEDDTNSADNTASFPVTVVASGPDLAVAAADVNTVGTPVGGGDVRPFRGAVVNQGDTTATGATVTLDLPTGVTVQERYSDCKYVSWYPKAKNTGGYIYGPGNITCPLPAIAPGDGVLLFDPNTGDAAFHLLFGRNLPGPGERNGTLSAALPKQVRAAAGVRSLAGDGSSTFAAELSRIQSKSKASASTLSKRKSALDEINTQNNFASFNIWSKKNTLDVQVTAKPVTGKVGQTVPLSFEVLNAGPSDGGGPMVLITAPTGTSLLPGKWCQSVGTELDQSGPSQLRCYFQSEWPTVNSGAGKIDGTVQLKINAKPGSNGTIYAESIGGGSAESNKANNTARIVVDEESGSGSTLPITGSNAALAGGIGGGVLIVGIVLALAFRRRRIVLQLPND